MLDASFPWLAFAPLLVAIQHGLTFGVSSALLLVLGAWAHTDLGAILGTAILGTELGTAAAGTLELGTGRLSAGTFRALAPWGTGCLLAAAVAGHFRDQSQSAIASLRRRYAEAAGRLSRLEVAHRVTRLSHARLEQRLAAERWSLDSGVLEAARQMAALDELKDLGRVALDVLANHALVQSASLFVPARGKLVATSDGDLALQRHWFGARAGHALEAAPLVVLGGQGHPPSTHPLVEAAWVTRRLQAVTSGMECDSANLEGAAGLTVLAAVPLLGQEGRLLGVIAITDMPFMAFQAEHLECLALLTAQLALLMEQRLANEPRYLNEQALNEQALNEQALNEQALNEQALDEQALDEEVGADEETFDLARKKSGLYRIPASPAPPASEWQYKSRKNRP